ncbi:MAG: hypothetical protein RR397_09840 [Odoribacter sp.]
MFIVVSSIYSRCVLFVLKRRGFEGTTMRIRPEGSDIQTILKRGGSD